MGAVEISEYNNRQVLHQHYISRGLLNSGKDLRKTLLDVIQRFLYLSSFLSTKDFCLVPHVTKPRKNVEKFESSVIFDYNKIKSSVGTLNKIVREYSCKRSTRR